MVLLPDRREPHGEGSPWSRLSRTIREEGGGLFGRRLLGILAPGDMPTDQVLSLLSTFEWHHPMSVVYMSYGENRWSFVTITGPARSGRTFEGAE